MKAMILAAGLGTRLRPLTNDRPKALVEVGGRTLLEITLARLREFGVSEVIVNVHHLSDMVVDYLKSRQNFGMRIEISREETLLDTGGGLKKAARFFQEQPERQGPEKDEPFFLHNVDVFSTINLAKMAKFHADSQALATLAVQDRDSSRYLLFDKEDRLCGRRIGRNGAPEVVGPQEPCHSLAFSGVHVISPRFLEMLSEQGAFSIIQAYLRIAAAGEKILAFRADEYEWIDLGRPENLARAQEQLKKNERDQPRR